MPKSWEIAPSTSARRLGAMLSMGVTVEDADNRGRFGTAPSSLSSCGEAPATGGGGPMEDAADAIAVNVNW